MATPTTTIGIEMARKAFLAHVERWGNDFSMFYVKPLMSLICNRAFLQRPYTDDMMQMCVDLGIDVPDYQPVSFDGLTFRFRR